VLLILEIISQFYNNSNYVKKYVKVKKYESEYIKVVNMLNNNASIEDLNKAFLGVKWVIFNKDVYDLTNFLHPGG
jgi:hypothetical protein